MVQILEKCEGKSRPQQVVGRLMLQLSDLSCGRASEPSKQFSQMSSEHQQEVRFFFISKALRQITKS